MRPLEVELIFSGAVITSITVVFFTARKKPSVNFNLLLNIVRMRTQSLVCENPISSFCEDINPDNPGKPQFTTYTTLFFSGIINARLRI